MAASVVASVALPISNNFSFAPSMDAYGKLSEYGKLGAWSPLSLFALGEQGAWYDPSDLSTMFQDSAGTTPVTAVGQPVGLILDKSGRNNHASQATAAARPLLQNDGVNNYLAFDGVDDMFLVLFGSTFDTGSIFTCMSYIGVDPIALGTGAANASMISQYNGTARIIAGNGPTSSVNCAGSPKFVGTLIGKSDNTGIARRNSIDLGLAPISGGIGLSAFAKLSIAVNTTGAGNFTLTDLYSLIVLGRLATTQEITDTETWVNGKTGAY